MATINGVGYAGSITSGVLAATLAADAPIFGLRNGPTQTGTTLGPGLLDLQRFVYIKEIQLRVSSTVAFTAIQQFGLYIERFSGANLAGGAAGVIQKVSGSGIANSVCLTGGAQGGDIRVSTTAALTTAGTTFDGNKIPIYGFTGVGPSDYPVAVIQFQEPLRLGVGEGLAIRNQIVWPAAGTAIVTGLIQWDERNS